MPGGAFRLRLVVNPGAARNELWRSPEGELRARVSAPAREGKANAALVRFLADRLGIPRSQVTLVRGESSRHKVIEVAGLSKEEALLRLGLR